MKTVLISFHDAEYYVNKYSDPSLLVTMSMTALEPSFRKDSPVAKTPQTEGNHVTKEVLTQKGADPKTGTGKSA